MQVKMNKEMMLSEILSQLHANSDNGSSMEEETMIKDMIMVAFETFISNLNNDDYYHENRVKANLIKW